jgi:transglutaminase-like putative cysteine protease
VFPPPPAPEVTVTMSTLSRIVVLVLAILSFAFSAPASPVNVPPLAAPPLGERWFSIAMNGERTGFAMLKIVQAEGGYEIESSGSVKMLVLGFSREAASREHYRVNRDLSLKSFTVEEIIDGSRMQVSGEVSAKGVRVTVDRGGKKEEKTFKSKTPLFPPSVLNIYPLMKGVAPGREYRLRTLDVEAVKVKEVKVSVVGPETLADGTRAVHLQNDLYTFVDNDIWVDEQGNTLRESVRDGLIVTAAEDKDVAARFLLDAAVAKRDLVLDFSLVPVTPPLPAPERLIRLAVELSGIPANVPLLEGGGQKAERVDAERVRFTMERSAAAGQATSGAVAAAERDRYLEANTRIPAADAEIMALKDTIVGKTGEPREAVSLLVRWVAANVEGTVTDSQSPLETLKSRKGNCQSHARLYTTMARAAGIPTRFVSGLVYQAGKGFLYHSWAESLIGGAWLAVDPTFAQVPADVTHIKLVEGETPEEMLPLAGVVGRVRAKVVEQR